MGKVGADDSGSGMTIFGQNIPPALLYHAQQERGWA